MDLSRDIVKQFATITNDSGATPTDNTVYGTVVKYNDELYAQIDGSEMITPISATANIKAGDRVIITLKNHSATVTGNLSDPSASGATVNEIGTKVTTLDTLVAEKATINQLNVEIARIDVLEADYVTVNGILAAQDARFETLEADVADITTLKAESAFVKNLDAQYANIDFTNIGKAAMEYFYSKSGLIENVVVGDQTITGKLVGVELNADLIKTGTLVADRLVIQGKDGLYYKLNSTVEGVTQEQLSTEEFQNGLHGDNIIAHTITAEKVNVKDLVAFDATIGGLKINDGSIYSIGKESATSTNRGSYIGADGQFAVGDSSHYLRFYKDTDGSFKLAISADSLSFSNGTDVETAFENLQNDVDNIEIGGRNLLLGTGTSVGWSGHTAFNPTDNEFRKSNTTTSENYFYCNNLFDLEAGQTYTLSFKAKQNGSLKSVGHDVYILPKTWTSTGIAYNPKITGLTTSYQTYAFTFAPNVNATSLENCQLRFDNEGSTTEGAEAILYIKDIKLEKGNKATDWSPAPEDIDADIAEAAKTATNFLEYDSTNGLQIGDKVSGSWKGFRAQVVSDAYNILDQNGNVQSSYGVDTIDLGKQSSDVKIKLCGEKGLIEYNGADNDPEEYLQVTGDYVRIKGDSMASVYSNYFHLDDNPEYLDGPVGTQEKSAVNVSPNQIHVYSTASYNLQYRDGNELIGNYETSEFTMDHLNANLLANYIALCGRSELNISTVSGPINIESGIGDLSLKAADNVNVTPTGNVILNPTGYIGVERNLLISNAKTIYGTATDGTRKSIFEPTNSSNNTVLGWGNYDQKSGETIIYGHDVKFGVSNIATPGTFRPYLRRGDTITINQLQTAGYVTNASTEVHFTLPLHRPVVGSPSVSASTTTGFILRQDNKYTHGSSSTVRVAPTKYSAILRATCIVVFATFSNITNVTNNAPIGIDWNGTITFS